MQSGRVYTIPLSGICPYELPTGARVSQSFQSYNNQLQELTQSILVMGNLVQQMIGAAHESLTAKTDALKDEVRELGSPGQCARPQRQRAGDPDAGVTFPHGRRLTLRDFGAAYRQRPGAGGRSG